MPNPPSDLGTSDSQPDDDAYLALFKRVDAETPPDHDSYVALRARIDAVLAALEAILDGPIVRFEGQDSEFHTELSGSRGDQSVGISISQWGLLATVTSPVEVDDPLLESITSCLRANALVAVPLAESRRPFDGDLTRYVRPEHAPLTWFDRFFGYL